MLIQSKLTQKKLRLPEANHNKNYDKTNVRTTFGQQLALTSFEIKKVNANSLGAKSGTYIELDTAKVNADSLKAKSGTYIQLSAALSHIQ